MQPEGNWLTRAPSPQAQGGPARQGAGRGRPRALSLCRRRDARHLARGDGRAAARGQGQVFLDLQLSDAVVGRHRRHRLAGGRRRHHEPDPAVPLQLWPLRARHDPHLQGGELPPAPGLRDHGDPVPGQRGAEGDGAGRLEPLVVAVADDVRALRQGEPAHRRHHEVEDQALLQRRPEAEVHRRDRAAGALPGPDVPRSRAEARREDRALAHRRDRLERVQARAGGRRPLQSPAHEGATPRRTRTAPGCARRRWRTPGSAPSARRRQGLQRSRGRA